jgi:hypothetical protein
VNAANLTALDHNNAVVTLRFQRTNYATGAFGTAELYTVPANLSTALPGDILKIEFNATAEAFSLLPTTAISRILSMTASYNGTAVPASVYILWPYLPRKQRDGTFPVIGFGHGTTGIFGEFALSHTRPLQCNYGVTYRLALQGYVVVAPDYAGLGVNQTATGSPILHPYGVNPTAANDLFYAVQAVQSAFATLSEEFSIVGHSQGGGGAGGSGATSSFNARGRILWDRRRLTPNELIRPGGKLRFWHTNRTGRTRALCCLS